MSSEEYQHALEESIPFLIITLTYLRPDAGTDIGAVWIVDMHGAHVLESRLRAFDVLTGRVIYTSDVISSSFNYDFPAITCRKRSVFVGTGTGFTCYGIG